MSKTEKSCKKDKSGSLENIPRENVTSRGGTHQQSKLKVPNTPHVERYSTGSPAIKLNTPTQNLMRNYGFLTKSCTPEIYTASRFETPKRSMTQQMSGEGEATNLVVAVRVRPLTTKESISKLAESTIQVNENEVNVITEYGQTHSFIYDHCFCGALVANSKLHDQANVYDSLAKPLLSQAFKGFNTCLFAYGQTGSGKSYSVMGTVGSERGITETSGIIPRFSSDVFQRIESLKKKCLENFSVEIQISYFEIYKEKIQDLLCPTMKSGGLRVREHPQNGPYVVDLSKHTVDSFEEVQRWLIVGNRQRATAATSANERSSRSHAIFTMILTQIYEEKLDGKSHEVRKQSRMNFIDLAGSERVASTHLIGDRREEGLTINQSLLTLGRVITALAEQNFVPYRESVLTWLLKESLGGDSKTVMLATVSPSPSHVEETLSTLRYACQARKIVNTARICEDSNARYIRHLREQLKQMECRLAEVNLHGDSESGVSAKETSRILQLEEEIQHLKKRLAKTEQKEDNGLQERVIQAEMKREEAEKALANYGLSTMQNPQQPCLVNVNQDPLLSGTLFFPLRPGKNWIGSSFATVDPPSIQLTGLMIEDKHCVIDVSEELKLTARAETYVNGHFIDTHDVVLHHGDRIIIGGAHYFHLHHPKDCKIHEKQSVSKISDFETAYEELKNAQEKRLQEAIRDAQDKARLQYITEVEELRQEAALEISLQRHSYEDEIATLNRVIQDRQSDDISSPSIVSSSVQNWEEIKIFIQDAENRLRQPKESTLEESPFQTHSILNELNAICRRFHQPYTFARREVLADELQPTVRVRDEDHQLVMYWTLDKMRQRLQIIREVIDEVGILTSEDIFEGGDEWQLEDDTSASFVPTIREELEKFLTRHESSITVLDESRFSLDTSRRSSFLPRSPPVNAKIADICKDLIGKFSDGDHVSTFVESISTLQSLLGHPDRSANFAISITVHSKSLLAIYPGLVNNRLMKKPNLPSSVREEFIKQSKDLVLKLKNSLEFVMQGISLDSQGLVNEWAQRTQSVLETIVTSYFELSVLCGDEFSTYSLAQFSSEAILGFVSAQKKIHQATIYLADEIRMKIAQLTDESLINSIDNSSFMNNGSLVKACHDCVTQVIILLERFTDMIETSNHGADYEKIHSKFDQRVDVLMRLGSSIENLFTYLELADLSQVKVHAAAMDVQTTSYTKLMDVDAATVLCDVSFAIGTLQKIVAEKRRMSALRRGRDIIYSPLPARLLASPYRKTSNNFDGEFESGMSRNSSLDNDQSDDEFSEEEDVLISSVAIQQALLFQTPTKSSFRKHAPGENQPTKSVRFDVSDPLML